MPNRSLVVASVLMGIIVLAGIGYYQYARTPSHKESWYIERTTLEFGPGYWVNVTWADLHEQPSLQDLFDRSNASRVAVPPSQRAALQDFMQARVQGDQDWRAVNVEGSHFLVTQVSP
jgi:hypothetical protein